MVDSGSYPIGVVALSKISKFRVARGFVQLCLFRAALARARAENTYFSLSSNYFPLFRLLLIATLFFLSTDTMYFSIHEKCNFRNYDLDGNRSIVRDMEEVLSKTMASDWKKISIRGG